MTTAAYEYDLEVPAAAKAEQPAAAATAPKKYNFSPTQFDTADDPYLYRHYVNLHPAANKILSKKWDDANRERHLTRLANIKPGINNAPPKVYMHLQLRLKKMQLEEDRLAQIERANRMLLEKMAHIVKYPSGISGLDHKNRISSTAYKGPWGPERRLRQVEKIKEENVKILGRIQSIRPVYDHVEWDLAHKKNLSALANIAAFPMKYIKERAHYSAARSGTRNAASKKDGEDKIPQLPPIKPSVVDRLKREKTPIPVEFLEKVEKLPAAVSPKKSHK